MTIHDVFTALMTTLADHGVSRVSCDQDVPGSPRFVLTVDVSLEPLQTALYPHAVVYTVRGEAS